MVGHFVPEVVVAEPASVVFPATDLVQQFCVVEDSPLFFLNEVAKWARFFEQCDRKWPTIYYELQYY